MHNSLLIDRKSTLAIVHIYSPTAPTECELQIPPTPLTSSHTIIDASAFRPAGEPGKKFGKGSSGGSATDPGNQIQIDLTSLRDNAFEPATPYSTPDEIILNIVHAACEKLAE